MNVENECIQNDCSHVEFERKIIPFFPCVLLFLHKHLLRFDVELYLLAPRDNWDFRFEIHFQTYCTNIIRVRKYKGRCLIISFYYYHTCLVAATRLSGCMRILCVRNGNILSRSWPFSANCETRATVIR